MRRAPGVSSLLPPGVSRASAPIATRRRPAALPRISANAVAGRVGAASSSASTPPSAPQARWASAAASTSCAPGVRSKALLAAGQIMNTSVTTTVSSATSVNRPRRPRPAPPATTVSIAAAPGPTSRSTAATSHAQKTVESSAVTAQLPCTGLG
jgi:hypothetical protein